MPHLPDPCEDFHQHFPGTGMVSQLSVPGRVNLIGEHIDYHRLPVLPVAIGRSIRVAFRRRTDRQVHAFSQEPYEYREFEWAPNLQPSAPGDWQNYVRAAARVVSMLAPDEPLNGIDAVVLSDLPPAAGISSSSALLIAFTLALLRANRIDRSFEELMEVLPDGEQFVGTRGGGMDHAAILASEPHCASRIEFDPLSVTPIAVPGDWGFLIAHSLQTAEKSGGAREAYNARRRAGTTALEHLGFPSYRAAIGDRSPAELDALAETLRSVEEKDSFRHVTSEAIRVYSAVAAMRRKDFETFGRLLLESHASLRDRLLVSSAGLDRVVEVAMESGAAGARLTGAGFGGFVVVFARKPELPELRRRLIDRYYSSRAEFDEQRHLIDVEPAAGVLYQEKHATPYN